MEEEKQDYEKRRKSKGKIEIEEDLELDEIEIEDRKLRRKKSDDFCQIRSAKIIQRNFRKYLQLKKIKNIFSEAEATKNNNQLKEEVSKENFKIRTQNMSEHLQKLPYNIWLDIFMFIPSIKQITQLQKVCHLFKEITELSILWMPILKQNFPLVYNKLNFEEVPKSKINWRNLVKEKQLQRNGFKEILKQLVQIKEDGNKLFKQKDYDKARDKYQQAMELITEDKYSVQKHQDIIGIYEKIEHFKINIILLSNIALMNFNLKSYFRCRTKAKLALSKLREIKLILSQQEDIDKVDQFKNVYEEQFGKLEEKVRYRLQQVEEEMPLPFSFYHHSEVPVDELRVGTMLTHNNGAFAGGFFADSKVIMTSFNRESSDITGIIINKYSKYQDRQILIGGPCELSKVTVLHNVPNVEGATQIVPGVWMGGNVQQYKNDPNYTIKEYIGYASWFTGQLDGEIRNGNGWEITNLVVPDDILNPQETFEMSINDY